MSMNMKTLDIAVYVLLLIGALNWGLIGLFEFDLVGAIFGQMSFVSRLIYTMVGLAALYDIVMLKLICKRWDVHWHKTVQG